MSSSNSHECSDHYQLNSEETLFSCERCKMNGFGPRYACTLCNDSVHRECRSPKMEISHEFFGSSTLTFSKEPDPLHQKMCIACEKKINGISYYSKPTEIYYLHPSCRHLDKIIVNEGIVFHLKKVSETNCSPCQLEKKIEEKKPEKKIEKKKPEKKNEVKNPEKNKEPETWGYESTSKKKRFHVYCMMEKVYIAKIKNSNRNQYPTTFPGLLQIIVNAIISESIREAVKSCLFCGSKKDDLEKTSSSTNPEEE